jgi:hypothetical protein
MSWQHPSFPLKLTLNTHTFVVRVVMGIRFGLWKWLLQNGRDCMEMHIMRLNIALF